MQSHQTRSVEQPFCRRDAVPPQFSRNQHKIRKKGRRQHWLCHHSLQWSCKPNLQWQTEVPSPRWQSQLHWFFSNASKLQQEQRPPSSKQSLRIGSRSAKSKFNLWLTKWTIYQESFRHRGQPIVLPGWISIKTPRYCRESWKICLPIPPSW